MGRNSILERLRQQSVERMRQERVTRLHRERKDRPIILEAEKKGDSAIVVPQAAAAMGVTAATAGAGASGGGHTPDTTPPTPPVDKNVALRIGIDTEPSPDGEPEGAQMPWHISSAFLDPAATIQTKVTRNGEEIFKEVNIENLTWDWYELGEPGTQQTTLEIPASQNDVLFNAGIYGDKSEMNATLMTAPGVPIPSVNTWEFGTGLNSIWGMSFNDGNLTQDLNMQGTQHLSSLRNFSMNNWVTDEMGVGVILDLNGNNTTNPDVLGGLSYTSFDNVEIKQLSLNNLTSYAHDPGPRGPIRGEFRIENCRINGPVSFDGKWKTIGAYSPGDDEPGSINITANTWGVGSSVSLGGLWPAYTVFNWTAEFPTPLENFDISDLRTATSITLQGHATLTSIFIGNVTCPNLEQLNWGNNPTLSSISTFANFKAPRLNTIILSEDSALTTEALTGFLGGLGTALNAGNLGVGGTLEIGGIPVDLTEPEYQIARLSVTDPGAGSWSVYGDNWEDMLNEFSGNITPPCATFEDACAEPFDPVLKYYSLAAELFDNDYTVMDDDQGTHGLSACYVRAEDLTGAVEVYRYYPLGNGPSSNIPYSYEFWYNEGECT